MYDIETGDKQKAVGLHFSRRDHNGTKDMEISVLEFIKKPPRSPEAVKIRDRVKKKMDTPAQNPCPRRIEYF
jgi:DNA polymerase elongation subunit (family B)